MQVPLRGCWLQLNPRRLCQVASASSVLSQSTKNDRVQFVAVDVNAAARQQKRSFAELHRVQHGGKSGAPIVVTDDGFDANRRSRTILVNASAAAYACASSHVRKERDASAIVCFFEPDVATIVSRNLVDRCS